MLRWGIPTDVGTLDPARIKEGVTASVLRQVVQTLVTNGRDGTPQPLLASSWQTSADGRTVTFTLANARFSDGTAVTSDDVRASFRRALDPRTQSAQADLYLGGIAAMETPDPHTLRVRLREPDPTFVAKLSYPLCSILPRRFAGRTIDTPSDLVGSGPFRLASYTAGEGTTLVPNERAWDGSPNLRKIEVLPIVDPAARLTRFRAGEIDLTVLPPHTIEGDHGEPGLRRVPLAAVTYLQFNATAFPAFADPRVRRAFAMAIDRSRLVSQVLQGEPLLADGLVPPGTVGRVPVPLPAYDPAEARRLLAEAGYPQGRGFPLLRLACNEANRTTPAVDAIVTDLRRNLDLSVEVQGLTSGALLAADQAHRLPLFFTGWTGDYNDPANYVEGLLGGGSPTNGSGYRNAEVDGLLRQARTARSVQRFRLIGRAESRALADLPILPIYFPRETRLVSRRLSGLALTPYGVGAMTSVHAN